ncbi:hypothetical protein, partial [Kitasatospora indigofera]|uniref:hypothetical protein n=1 Tax=Kitasatospora indigofera TaxID=67307 RepID=UPI0036D00965
MRNTARVQQLTQAIRKWGRAGAEPRRTGTLLVAVLPLVASIVLGAPFPPLPAVAADIASAPTPDTAAVQADAARTTTANPLLAGAPSAGVAARNARLRAPGATTFAPLAGRLAEQGTTAADPGGELALSLSVSKVSGDVAGPIRAGDVLQYHAAVKNTGTRDWTTVAPLRFQSPLGDLLDDAVLSGTQQGALAKCGPGLWDSYYCKPMAGAGPTELSHPFALKAGASHFFSYRVQISNNFAGDQALLSTVSVAGERGNGESRVEVTAELSDTVAVQHPDLAIVDQGVTKVGGDAAGPIRAGDVLQYHVVVQNTGDGDWTAGSKWAEAVLIGAQQGSSARCGPGLWDGYYCKPTAVAGPTALEHEFALKAGAKHYFNYRVQISNSFDGDQELRHEASVSAETGNGRPRAEDSGTVLDTVAVQHPDLAIVDQGVTKVVGDASGPIRAGDVLQYHVVVQNTGDG